MATASSFTVRVSRLNPTYALAPDPPSQYEPLLTYVFGAGPPRFSRSSVSPFRSSTGFSQQTPMFREATCSRARLLRCILSLIRYALLISLQSLPLCRTPLFRSVPSPFASLSYPPFQSAAPPFHIEMSPVRAHACAGSTAPCTLLLVALKFPCRSACFAL